MWLFNSASGILTVELTTLFVLVLILAKRLSGKKADSDLSAMSEFLEKIDKQTLIKLSDLDKRSDNRHVTIKKDIEEIDYNSRLIRTALEEEAIKHQVNAIGLADICLTNVSKAYLRILSAVNAIKDRENARLQRENDELAAKLRDATKLIDDIELDYTHIKPAKKQILLSKQKHFLKILQDSKKDIK